LLAGGDHANRADRLLNSLSHELRVRDLIAGANRNFDAGDESAGRDVEEVDALFGTPSRNDCCLFFIPAAFFEVGSREAHKQWHSVIDCCSDASNDFEQESRAILEAPAVLVGAVVGERRQELVN
jgi:hypothetical protein